MARVAEQRRGVLLLVVLTILVLFFLLGTTYLIVATHYHRQAQGLGRHERMSDSARQLADRAMYQLLRDTRNSDSSLQHHSLLADLYGEDGFMGQVIHVDPRVSQSTLGQFLRMEFEVIWLRGAAQGAGYYNGAVITMLTGQLKGQSSRIIHSPDIATAGASDRLYLLAENFNAIGVIRRGDVFLVNGVPFNGTGAGYDPRTGRLDLGEDADGRVALLPHFKKYVPPMPVNLGGLDESYDAVDMQNMFLAKIPPDAEKGEKIITPSFHRPRLIHYWLSQLSPEATPDRLKTLLLKIVMRPTPLEHSRFTGSNPAWDFRPDNVDSFLKALLTGPWDVDNDGDRVPDSIWLDLGEPNSATPDGRLFRPLFAILCTDLDGRLNVNVHGNLAHLDDLQLVPVSPEGMVPTRQAVRPARGLGVGPAEVNLEVLFDRTEYASLLLDRYRGRFAEERLPAPGMHGVDDLLSRLKGAMLPPDYAYQQQMRLAGRYPAWLHAFASPPDFFGRGAILLDRAGQPLFVGMGLVNEAMDDPYELNVVEGNAWDAPFTVSEMEGVLRFDDADAGLLGSRLRRLAPNTLSSGPAATENRRLITTHSFHVPAAAFQLPSADLRRQFGPATTFVTWVRHRLKTNGVPNIAHQLQLMLPFEIRRGEKMDLNRLWSDARDGVHDEFGRPSRIPGTVESALSLLSPRAGPAPENLYRDARAAPGRFAQTRQMFARHLYCLVMMLLPPGYTDPAVQLERIPRRSQQAAELTARRIAQWAVNVVDFRDADAIMTPFEYDWNPMNGWQEDIDGDLNTVEGGDRRVVWGCEFPHLLLTETLAFHDTRLKDSKWDSGEAAKRLQPDESTSESADPVRQDDDLDQYRVPQGSFFAELYCPFDANNRHPEGTTRIPPPELYVRDPKDGMWKVDLARVPPLERADGGVYPVWRLAITRPHGEQESVLASLQSWPETTTLQPDATNDLWPKTFPIDRIVWFAAVRPTPTTFPTGRIYWNYAPGGTPAWLAGKQYAVVGPRTKTFLGSKRSAVDPTRREPADRVLAFDRQPAGGYHFRASTGFSSNVRRPLGVVAAMPPPVSWQRPQATAPEGIGVSISEPLPSGLPGETYYPEPAQRVADHLAFLVTDAYGSEDTSGEKLPDVPLDSQDGRPIAELHLAEGTQENYRTVFLQRLANPLRSWNPSPGHSHHDPRLPVNPYITVDWMPVDLTVFNGEEMGPPAEWDSDWNWTGEIVQQVRFSTRERGNDSASEKPDLYAWNIAKLRRANEAVDQDHYFREPLAHTLGYLNTTYHPRRTGSGHYQGDPQLPFPWLTWNDRPFANALELMLVPTSSAPRLTVEYTTDTRQNPYSGGLANLRSPFSHLLNFFHSSGRGGTSPNLGRLLELVEVPSPYVGTQRWYNPSFFGRASNADPSVVHDPIIGTFRPPFNKLSRFRDPGRVNLNTIFDERVWRAMAWGFPAKSDPAFWQRLVQSRRGYASGEEDQYPTEFANPFRSALGADLHFDLMGNRPADTPEIEATLLRSSPDDRSRPLFEDNSDLLYNDTDQNPYFRYQFMRRLGSIASTHSNVFAVWITVGYFEVDAQTGQLGRELNAGTGEVERHRAFYIIDRSIPVAFEPGRNHNVDDAILLRRLVE